MYLAVCILRLQDGLDYSKIITEEEEYMNGHAHPVSTGNNLNVRHHSQEFIPRNESFMQMSAGNFFVSSTVSQHCHFFFP